MGKPAAKKGDQVISMCTHTVLVPTPSGAPQPQKLPHPFAGVIDDKLSSNVRIGGQPAAVVGSSASNTPHIPTPPGTAFQSPPKDKAELEQGSKSVRINGKAAVRAGDPAKTCDEMGVKGQVVAVGTVNIGD